MKYILHFFFVLSFISCSSNRRDVCSVPEMLLSEINSALQDESFSEEDLSRLNNMLFDYAANDSLASLSHCDEYKKSIDALFNSSDENKRVLGYRLIGVAKDTNFNTQLLGRVRSDENSLLKTWSASAVMENKVPNSSDDLFKLFMDHPDGLPVNILINKYVSYDIPSVKKTCWKHIDSEIRNEQILAIQILSTFERDEQLQSKLVQFLSVWEIESKGWVISAMAQQHMSDLKPILERYSANQNLKEVIITALENSSSRADNEFAKKLSF